KARDSLDSNVRAIWQFKFGKLQSNADTRVIEVLRFENAPLDKGARLNPSATEPGKPSTASLTRLKHIPDTAPAVPATSTMQ
ncbi:hypothetical protein KIN20_007179, partial [Parelaphostrongylus tenuis]